MNPSKLRESVMVKPQILPESVKAFKESVLGNANAPQYLLPRIEAIHAGTTRNFTRYPSDKLKGDQNLKSGVYSWLYPYPKPVIYNHDTSTNPTGRVQSAYFTEYTSASKPGIVVIPKITDQDTINSILEGRLLTVSIGATTDAATCSICGTNILEEFCGHMKGESYDGTTAEWIVGNVWFDELSWVNVPSDQHAMIIDKGGVSTAESYAYNGREIINLGRKTTEWLVDPKVAISEGLLVPEKKGEEILAEAKEVQALEEGKKKKLKKQLEAVSQELEDLKVQLEKVETEKQALEEALAEKEQKLQEAEEKLKAKEAEVAELQESKTSLEQEKAALQTAYQETLAVNVQLSEELHKTLVESVVRLRMSLGKESDHEQAVERFKARTTESLKDTLSDLLAETTELPRIRTIEKVEHPGADTDGTEEKDKKAGLKEELTSEDVIMALLTGRKPRKK